MQYCLVVEGKLMRGPERLPKAWKNIAGLDKASTSKLKELGWLPAVIVKPEFDSETHKRGKRNHSIGTDDVTFTWPVVPLTKEDKISSWERKMNESDKDLSRVVEDMIDSMSRVQFSKLPNKTKIKSSDKKSLRSKSPQPINHDGGVIARRIKEEEIITEMLDIVNKNKTGKDKELWQKLLTLI